MTSIGIASIKRTMSTGIASIKNASVWTLGPLDLFPGWEYNCLGGGGCGMGIICRRQRTDKGNSGKH